jgi:hypothetical protein
MVRIIVGIVLVCSIYFLPTGVALLRNRTNKITILLLNLFGGWTGILWVVALVLGAMHRAEARVVVSSPPQTVSTTRSPTNQPSPSNVRASSTRASSTRQASTTAKSCSQCGHSLSESNDPFCNNCGSSVAPIHVLCPSCNAELPNDSRFCGKCGSAVATAQVESVSSQHSESTNQKRCGHCDAVITESDIFLYGQKCPHCDKWNDNIKNS